LFFLERIFQNSLLLSDVSVFRLLFDFKVVKESPEEFLGSSVFEKQVFECSRKKLSTQRNNGEGSDFCGLVIVSAKIIATRRSG